MLSRQSFLAGAAAFAAISAAGLSGCGGFSSGSSASATNLSVKIGTMPTEDILPVWVAESEGLFDAQGVVVEVLSFDSAQNLSAAITAGEVDLAMTDPMRTIKLCEAGTNLSMEWITLGTTAAQGRFGILTAQDSGIDSLADLVGCPHGVGVAANTVPEYVLDKLCEQAGIDPASVTTTEVASLPDRYSLVASGNLDAAALPASMLALGEAAGMLVLADDTVGDNISQSVMVARTEFNSGDGAKAIAAVRAAWDNAANLINENPEDYRDLLMQNANLNSVVADTYPISAYPLASTDDDTSAYPPANLIDPQISWMQSKGYSSKEVSYDESAGTFEIA